MSIHTLASHTPSFNTTAHLAYAMKFLRHANLEQRLASARPPRSNRGVKATYAKYTAEAIAAAQYEVVAAGLAYSHRAVFDALNFRYTDEHMEIIGLGEFREPARIAAMTPPPGAPTHVIANATRAYKAEYQRFWQQFTELFAPMDDTPLVANHGRTVKTERVRAAAPHERHTTTVRRASPNNQPKKPRPTIEQVATAAADPDLVPKADLKHDIINALIAAALTVENEQRHPGTTLHNGGILNDHQGHGAVDETHLPVSRGVLPRGIAPGNLLARRHGHGAVYKGAPALIGLTLAVTVANPNQPNDVPPVALGAAIHHPTGGLGAAVVKIVDSMKQNNVHRPATSNERRHIVVDGGYTRAVDLNRQLTNRGYSMVMKYAKNQQVLHEIGATNNDDGTRTPGIRLWRGTPFCPGMSMQILERTNLTVPGYAESDKKRPLSQEEQSEGRESEPLWTETIDDFYDGKKLAEREQTIANLKPFIMSTNGLPRETANRPRGGQRKNAPTPEPVMQATLICPHAKGTARCPAWSDYNDPELAGLPVVPDPPTYLPVAQRPTCCTNKSGTIQARIPLQPYKDWQPHLPGTWEHADWFTGPRSANERYNSLIKHTLGGPNLTKGTIGPRKAAPFALFTVMAIINANRRSIETWYAHINTHGGTKPKVRAAANQLRRNNLLTEYRRKQKARRSSR